MRQNKKSIATAFAKGMRIREASHLTTRRPDKRRLPGESKKAQNARISHEKFWYGRYLAFLRSTVKKGGMKKEVAQEYWRGQKPKDRRGLLTLRMAALSYSPATGWTKEGQRLLSAFVEAREERYMLFLEQVIAMGFSRDVGKDFWFSPKVQ